MKIYLAGNNALSKEQRENLYNKFLKKDCFLFLKYSLEDLLTGNGNGSMKIYLASTAPGHEGKKEKPVIRRITNRLLSYHHIAENILQSTVVFNGITGEKYASRKEKANQSPRRSKARARK